MKFNRTIVVFAYILTFSLLAACAAPQGLSGTPTGSTNPEPKPLPTNTLAPTETAPPIETSAPTRTATLTSVPATATGDPQSLCPQPGVDTSLYISKENGFCFLVPAGFEIQKELQRPGEVVTLLGPRETMEPKQQEGVSVMLSIETNGLADGMDSGTYAAEWHKRFTAPGDPFDATEINVGGQPATVLSNLPGYARQQSVFVIANGVRYRISLMPQPGEVPELDEAAMRGMETLLNSMVFLRPENTFQAVKAADVCPAETEGTRLYVNEIEGYCFLYPAEFGENPDFPGSVEAATVVGQWEGGDVHPSVTVGFYTPPGDMTASQILEQRMQFVQPGSVEETTIGGYPAVTFIDLNGAWPSRQAIVVVDPSRAYSVLAQPLDEARFPGAQPLVEKGWETLLGSLTFFNRWR